jgi:TRAP-type uncharacterized transport system substrate-binding protein
MSNSVRLALKLVLIGACVLAAAALAKLAFDSLRYPLTVASPARYASASVEPKIVSVLAEERPHVHLRRVLTPDFEASAAALDRKEADLAIIRTDVKLPPDGETIAMLGRDPVFLIVQAGSNIESFRDLKGGSVAMLDAGRDESAILDRLLEYYAVAPKTVARSLMTPADIGPAIRQKRIAAVFAVLSPQAAPAVEAFAAVAKAGKGAPDIIGVEEGEAVAKQFGDVESGDIPQGAFGGASPRPEESVATIFVTYRLMADHSMSNFVAGEIAKILMLAKSRLMGSTPLASGIEAPDKEKDSVPIHPGASAYYDDEQDSIFDRFESLFWMGTALSSVAGSLIAWALSRFRRNQATPVNFGARLLGVLREARTADRSKLEDLESDVDDIVGWLIENRETSQFGAEEIATLTFAVSQVREALRKRREALAVRSQEADVKAAEPANAPPIAEEADA